MLCGLLLAATAQATLTLSVDRTPVALNESFTLTLSSDESLDGEPDFGWIDRELEVVSRQQSSNFQLINGEVSRSITWSMTVLPRVSGTLLIPPVKVGDVASNPLTLQVTEAATAGLSSPGAAPREGLLLEVEAGEGELYVQQQLLYTIRLLVAQNGGISVGNGSSLSEPELEAGEAVIKRLGEDSSYQAVRDGERYAVVERRYAIYPQQSGPLRIRPVQFTGQMVAASGRSRSPFDLLGQRSQIKRLASAAVEREVQAVPPTFQGRNWLPAKNVELVEQWPTGQQMVAGEPVTRTVALIVDGLTSAQLPALEQAYPPALKSYPDQPQLKETPSAQGVSAVRQEKIALLASAPGTLTLPAMEVPWWNTATQRQEIARLPAREITVVAPPGAEVPAPLPPLTLPPSTPMAATAPPVTPDARVPVWQRHGGWPLATLLLALAWLLTLLLWWRSGRVTSAAKVAAAAPVAHPQSTRALERRIGEACRAHRAEAAKEALLQWGRSRWPEGGALSLGELASRLGGELGEQIAALSRLLYSPSSPLSPSAGEWRGDRLWQAFTREPHPQGDAREGAQSALAPLFRHQPL